MAAEKTDFIYREITQHSKEVYDWLKANATSYFTSIVQNEDGSIVCSLDDTEVLKLFIKDNDIRCLPFTVSIKTGDSITTGNIQYTSGKFSFDLAYKTDDALFLINKSQHHALFITHESDGSLIILGTVYINTTEYYHFVAEVEKAPYIAKAKGNEFTFYSFLTSLTPVCTYMGEIIPKLYMVMFTPYGNQSCIITDGSRQYLFAYAFALEI